MASNTYLAACFCGRVELTVSGSPLFAGYCHCESCRTWLGAPIHAATLWHPRDVEIRSGEELPATYKKTQRSHRKHCTACGGHVMNAHPSEETIDVLAPTIRGFPFTPTMHVHYGEHIMVLRDGLPKYRDLPKELGGPASSYPKARLTAQQGAAADVQQRISTGVGSLLALATGARGAVGRS